MKQLVLVAVLAAVASSALTLLGTMAFIPAPSPLLPDRGAVSQLGMEGVVQELASFRRELDRKSVV